MEHTEHIGHAGHTGHRRAGRARALQMLYGRDIGGASNSEIPRDRGAVDKISRGADEFAEQLFTGVVARLDELDRTIQSRAQNWRLNRMAAVDRNILRLAVFELSSGGKSPDSAIINEAIELARKFSTQDSAQFVNGILDGIRKDLAGSSYED